MCANCAQKLTHVKAKPSLIYASVAPNGTYVTYTCGYDVKLMREGVGAFVPRGGCW